MVICFGMASVVSMVDPTQIFSPRSPVRVKRYVAPDDGRCQTNRMTSRPVCRPIGAIAPRPDTPSEANGVSRPRTAILPGRFESPDGRTSKKASTAAAVSAEKAITRRLDRGARSRSFDTETISSRQTSQSARCAFTRARSVSDSVLSRYAATSSLARCGPVLMRVAVSEWWTRSLHQDLTDVTRQFLENPAMLCAGEGNASRRWVAHAVANQHCPECVEHATQTAVHIELRSAGHYSRDLRSRQFVFEAQSKQKPVIRLQRGHSRFESPIELKRSQAFLGPATRSVDELRQLGIIGDQIHQTPAHSVTVFVAFVIATHSAVLLTLMIEA